MIGASNDIKLTWNWMLRPCVHLTSLIKLHAHNIYVWQLLTRIQNHQMVWQSLLCHIRLNTFSACGLSQIVTPLFPMFLPRDLLESGIGKEEKAMKKLQSVLTRLKARQAHQASLYHEAKTELHKFRVGWILSWVFFRFISVIPNNGAEVDNAGCNMTYLTWVSRLSFWLRHTLRLSDCLPNIHEVMVYYAQRSAKRLVLGCEKFVPALAYLFSLPLPGPA